MGRMVTHVRPSREITLVIRAVSYITLVTLGVTVVYPPFGRSHAGRCWFDG